MSVEAVKSLVVAELGVSVAPHAHVLIDDVSLEVSPHQTLGIVGESGAGKSVLVRAILGLTPDDWQVSGSVEFEGRSLQTLSTEELRQLRGARIAAILPNARAHLPPVIRIGDLMAAALRAHGDFKRADAAKRSTELLSQVGIQDAARRLQAYPHELSGGMAQRVCIALALMHHPSVIVADEPTAGLDVTVQRQILDTMSELVRDRGTAQIIVTRDFGISAHYCDHLVVMREGRVVEQATPQEIFHAPQSDYTKKLIKAVSQPRGAKNRSVA